MRWLSRSCLALLLLNCSGALQFRGSQLFERFVMRFGFGASSRALPASIGGDAAI